MTLGQLLSQVDDLCPNRFSRSQKIHWISEAEQAIYRDILRAHEDAPEEFFGYDEATSAETPLLVPPPYDRLYRWYVQAQMDLCHGEFNRYNNSMSLYNAACLSFQDFYNRSHRPLTRVKRFRA